MSDKTSVIFVCLGNICRSPLGEGVFRHKVEAANLSDRFHIESAGTSAYHVGELPDPGSIKVAQKHGLDITYQRAQQFRRDDIERFDYIIAMDQTNRRNILRLTTPDAVRGRLWMMRNFEHETDGSGHDADVPDPWGGGPRGFDDVYGIVDRSTTNLLEFILSRGS